MLGKDFREAIGGYTKIWDPKF
jgi:magnesium-transporting ATPase (P-type)